MHFGDGYFNNYVDGYVDGYYIDGYLQDGYAPGAYTGTVVSINARFLLVQMNQQGTIPLGSFQVTRPNNGPFVGIFNLIRNRKNAFRGPPGNNAMYIRLKWPRNGQLLLMPKVGDIVSSL